MSKIFGKIKFSKICSTTTIITIVLSLLSQNTVIAGPGDEICPARPLVSTGVFKTVKSPPNFPSSFYCKLVFKPRNPKKQVELEFNDFKMADSPSCAKQKIEIYDGMVGEMSLISRFCGVSKPHRITSTKGRLIVLVISKLANHETWMGQGSMYEIGYRENVGWDEFKENEALAQMGGGKKGTGLGGKGLGGGGKKGKGIGDVETKDGKYVISGPPQKKYPQQVKNRAKMAVSRVYATALSDQQLAKNKETKLLSDGSDEGASMLTYAGIGTGVILVLIIGGVMIQFSFKKKFNNGK